MVLLSVVLRLLKLSQYYIGMEGKIIRRPVIECEIPECGRWFKNRSGYTKHRKTFHRCGNDIPIDVLSVEGSDEDEGLSILALIPNLWFSD